MDTQASAVKGAGRRGKWRLSFLAQVLNTPPVQGGNVESGKKWGKGKGYKKIGWRREEWRSDDERGFFLVCFLTLLDIPLHVLDKPRGRKGWLMENERAEKEETKNVLGLPCFHFCWHCGYCCCCVDILCTRLLLSFLFTMPVLSL